MKFLLFSGGLDSFIYWRLLKEPTCLYVPMGHRYGGLEYNRVKRMRTRHPSLEIIFCERLPLGAWERPDAYIPFRNLILATFAALPEDVTAVYLGAVAGESSRDKSTRFFNDASRLLSFLEGRKIQVAAPYRHLTKAQLVALYLKEGHPADDLYNTTSCYNPRGTYSNPEGFCGRCRACFRRWVAMYANGLHEQYYSPPWEFEVGTPSQWLANLKQVPLREWPAVLRNNHHAYQMVYRARREEQHRRTL